MKKKKPANTDKNNSRYPLVSIVVPARNAEKTIQACIQSILASTYPEKNREIIVVDNASADRTAQLAKENPVVYVHEPRRGRGHARNAGINHARGDIICFTDSDCTVEPDWLEQIMRTFNETTGQHDTTTPGHNGSPGIVIGKTIQDAGGGLLRDYTRTILRQGFYIQGRLSYGSGANTSYRHDLLQQAGPFRTDKNYPEDAEMGLRLTRKGATIRYNPKAIVYHAGHPDTRTLLRRYFEYGRGMAVMCSEKKEYRKPSIYTPGALAAMLILAAYLLTINISAFLALVTTALALFTVLFTRRYRQAGGKNMHKTPIYVALDIVRRTLYMTGMAYGNIAVARKPWLILHSI